MSTQAAPPRTVHVEHCMGTVFSIDIRDAGAWDDALADVVDGLHRVDTTFSTYRADSIISRVASGELGLAQCPGEVRDVLDLCAEVETESGGYFSRTASGVLDPSGLVKGWAIERASDLLSAHGARNHAVNGGGDLALRGVAAPGRPWRVGISDPLRPERLLTVVEASDAAVATSGIAERGAHIIDPMTRAPAAALASVTVVGPRITLVDAYATAAFAMGVTGRAWIEALTGYEALGVAADGSVWRTSGFAAVAEATRG